MSADVWKERDVAAAFLDERALLIPDRQRQLDTLLRLLRAGPRRPTRLLDLGTGDGILLATTLEAFPEAQGIALDYSPLMLEQARARLARYGDRATVVEADLAVPGWRERVAGEIDTVVSSFAIHHLPHERKQALYGEVFGLLPGDGWFLNLEHVASQTEWGQARFDDAMIDHLYAGRRAKGDDVTAEQVRREFMERPDRGANILATVEEQCGWLREIGFREVDCYWKYFELALFGGMR